MSWAEKVRSVSQSQRRCDVVNGNRAPARVKQSSEILRLPAEIWNHIFMFVTQYDLCMLIAPVCRLLCSLHRLDCVWREKCLTLHEEMVSVYGTSTIADKLVERFLECSSFEAYRNLQSKFVLDIKRQHSIGEDVVASYDVRSRFRLGFRCFDRSPTTRRIPISELSVYQILKREKGNEVLSPEAIGGLCDNIRAGVEGLVTYGNATEFEQDEWLFSMRVSLSPENAGDNVFHNLGPRVSLLEVNIAESQRIAERMGAARILRSFFVDASSTRFFASPQLTRGDAIGLVAVDEFRVLLFQQREN